MIETDVLIIGSGIAGLTAAYYLGESNINTVLITKEDNSEESNTLYAQGGIVGRGKTDAPEALKKDIISAGDGISNPEAIDIIISKGVFLVKELLIDKLNVPFTRDEKGELLYTKEANHSRRRILFAKDESGKAIENSLVAGVKKQKSVKILTCHTAIDLITTHHHSENPLRIYKEPEVLGAYVFNRKRNV